MKQICIIVLVLVLSTLGSIAQNAPLWVESEWRQANYPNSSFLTGFAQDVKNSNETVAKATERVKNLAKGNLAGNVLSTIHSVAESYIQSVEYGNNEKIQKTFETQTKAETNATINGIKVDSYYNPQSNYVYAFAYSNRNEVIGYYKAQINMHIQQIEGFIASALQLSEQAEKIKAETEYNKTIPLFAKIEYAQGLLTAIDKDADENGLQIQKSIALRNKVVQSLTELGQGTTLFILCNAQLFTAPTNLLESKLKAQLATSKYNFVNDSALADWLVIIEAKAEEHNDINQTFFSYVNATVKLTKRYNNQLVYQDELKEKGGSAINYNDAAKKAYAEIAHKINEQLIKYIK